ncbi:MAG: hypothetical protein ACLQUZ_13995 [Rhizomicrobium sp.]
MTMPHAYTFSQAIGLLIVLYLAGLLIIAQRLKKFHTGVWQSLGNPSLLNWSISNSFRLGAFVFFRSGYRTLDDTALARLIWAIRVLVLVIFAAIGIWLAHYHGGPKSN